MKMPTFLISQKLVCKYPTNNAINLYVSLRSSVHMLRIVGVMQYSYVKFRIFSSNDIPITYITTDSGCCGAGKSLRFAGHAEHAGHQAGHTGHT